MASSSSARARNRQTGEVRPGRQRQGWTPIAGATPRWRVAAIFGANIGSSRAARRGNSTR